MLSIGFINFFIYIVNFLIDNINYYTYNVNINRKGGYNNMSVEEQIKILCVKKDISLSELARLNNISPQNFSQKLKRNTLTVDDLKAIADKLECTYQTSFVLPNGEKVEY
jgi:hypothetical protein